MGRRGRRSARSASNRGSTLERLILDTTILIDAERHRLALDDLIDDEDDVAIAAVTLAELLVGVELADRSRRRSREQYVAKIVATVPIESYDSDVARAHARLLAHVRGAGRARGAHDLIIAATALARMRTVVTVDETGFADLPGVAVKLA